MTLTHINPDSMHRNPAFSQGVLVQDPGAILVVGGQNGVDAEGQVVGDDLASQTAQALRNVLEVLKAAGASQEHVVEMTIYVAAPADIREGFAASQEVWGNQPTAISVIQVAALGRPDFLVEIRALAVIPK